MSGQLELEMPADDFRDVQRLGYIERRPVPEREAGHLVGHDDRGMPIYLPVWADFQWFATRVSAEALRIKRDRTRLIGTHRRMVDHALRGTDTHQASTEQLTDWRDALATMRDLWDQLHAREAAR